MTKLDLTKFARIELEYRKARWASFKPGQAKLARKGKFDLVPAEVRRLSADQLRAI